jgi:hypothetical protein
MVNSPGGEASTTPLLLLLLELLFKAMVTGTLPEFACVLFGWSELFDRKRPTLFFGLSTADFDLGRPTFGRDPPPPVSAIALSSVFFTTGSTPS